MQNSERNEATMREKDFQKNIIKGADALLEMMNKNPAMYMKIAHLTRAPLPSEKTSGLYRLYLDDYVREGAAVYFGDKLISSIEIRKLHMKQNAKFADIFVPEGASSSFEKTDYQQITLRTDMRFLIENIKKFYSDHEIRFFPPSPDEIPAADISLDFPLSDQQKTAVEATLSNPVTYVWGAPGTGKTKSVLSTCLLRYIFAKRRVLLLAPTNNAVEQSLRAILPILEKNEVPLKNVYRLGTASYEFAQQYPEVVGDRSLEQRAEELTRQAATLKREKENTLKRQADIADLEKRIAELEDTIRFVDIQLPLFRDSVSSLSNCFNDLESKNQHLSVCQERYDHGCVILSSRESLINNYKSTIDANLIRIKRLRMIPWKRKEYKQLCLQNQQLEEQMQAVMLTLKTIIKDRDDAQSDLLQAKDAVLCAQSDYEKQKTEHAKIRDQIIGSCNRVGLSFDIESSADTISTELSCHYNSIKEKYDSLINNPARSIAEIENEQAETAKMQSALGISSKLEQYQNALLVASTFDAAVGQLPKLETAEPYSHVFIDEAGYASMARGMIAFSCRCPVSFLGDHFQLPPICEMSNSRIREANPSVSLWALPVVAYSNLIHNQLPRLVSLIDTHAYSFDALKYVQLLKTYRFGSKLAHILDNYVYHTTEGFEGVDSKAFEIIVLHGCKQSTDPPHTSKAEATMICQLLELNKDKLTEDSFIILAPYKAQVKQLKGLMHDQRNSILTVHRAQGMEWDTVIISVCDTREAYFTNSSLHIGKCVLNTAISRAKKRIIIVCDTDFWKLEDHQLITELISQKS